MVHQSTRRALERSLHRKSGLGVASGTVISGGGEIVSSGGSALATVISGGTASEGIAGAPGSGTTVHSGGYEFAGGGPHPAEANAALFSGGGLMQLDSLLSQFAGVISGFDLGDDIGPHSLGFGSSSSAMS